MELIFTPAGHLMMTAWNDDAEAENDSSHLDERIASAFANCPSAGIIALSGGRIPADSQPSWRHILQLRNEGQRRGNNLIK